MSTYELATQLAREFKGNVQYQNGQWFYRRSEGWHKLSSPRLEIWKAILKHQPDASPKDNLASDVQCHLEGFLTAKHT